MTKENTVMLLFLCVFTCVLFLPAMHERYVYLLLKKMSVFRQLRSCRMKGMKKDIGKHYSMKVIKINECWENLREETQLNKSADPGIRTKGLTEINVF